MDTCYLVDYENVKEKGLTGCLNLTAKDSICIFYTENAKNVSWDIFCNHGDAVLTVKKVPTGDQSLDKHLIAWLGYLLGAGKAQEMDFVIVSRDTGFDRIIRFWKAETGITVRRCAQIEDYEKLMRQKPSAGAPAQAGEPSADSLTAKPQEPQEAERTEQPVEELPREQPEGDSRKSQQRETSRKPQPKAEISRTEQSAQESQKMPQTSPAQKEEPPVETGATEESGKAVSSDIQPQNVQPQGGQPQNGQPQSSLMPQEQPQNESARNANAQPPKNNARNNRRQRTQQNKSEARRKTSLNSEVQQVLARAKLPFHNGEINATAKVVSRVYWKEDALSLIHNELRRLYPEEYQDIYALVKPIIERYRKEQREIEEESAAQEISERETTASPMLSADSMQAEDTKDIRETERTPGAENTAEVPEAESTGKPETAETKGEAEAQETGILPQPEPAEEAKADKEPEIIEKQAQPRRRRTVKKLRSMQEVEPEIVTEPESAEEPETATEPEPAEEAEAAANPETAEQPEAAEQSETEKEERPEPVKATDAEKIAGILAEADYPQEIADFVTQIFVALRNGQIGKMQVYRNILQKYGRTMGISIYRNIRELL